MFIPPPRKQQVRQPPRFDLRDCACGLSVHKLYYQTHLKSQRHIDLLRRRRQIQMNGGVNGVVPCQCGLYITWHQRDIHTKGKKHMFLIQMRITHHDRICVQCRLPVYQSSYQLHKQTDQHQKNGALHVVYMKQLKKSQMVLQIEDFREDLLEQTYRTARQADKEFLAFERQNLQNELTQYRDGILNFQGRQQALQRRKGQEMVAQIQNMTRNRQDKARGRRGRRHEMVMEDRQRIMPPVPLIQPQMDPEVRKIFKLNRKIDLSNTINTHKPNFSKDKRPNSDQTPPKNQQLRRSARSRDKNVPPVPPYMFGGSNNTQMGSYGVLPSAPMASFGNTPGQMMTGIGFTSNQTPGNATNVIKAPQIHGIGATVFTAPPKYEMPPIVRQQKMDLEPFNDQRQQESGEIQDSAYQPMSQQIPQPSISSAKAKSTQSQQSSKNKGIKKDRARSKDKNKDKDNINTRSKSRMQSDMHQ